ncbi:hypothetical protein, partial [Thermosynechococcus sp.]|uniref:hypothetical protein n=1 Tax=Thermosynechococcus sp. TaxID=2814275 RepID=UPI00391D65CD
MDKALVKTKILLFGFSRSFVLFLVSLNFLCLGSNIAFAQEFRGRDPFKVELDCSRGIINYNSAECT